MRLRVRVTVGLMAAVLAAGNLVGTAQGGTPSLSAATSAASTTTAAPVEPITTVGASAPLGDRPMPRPTSHGGQHKLGPIIAGRTATSGVVPPTASAATPPAGQAPPNPAANIKPSPAFPDNCYAAPDGTPCEQTLVAALNNARAALHQPKYSLPPRFYELTPSAQLLVLTNSDRALYGLPPVLGLNSTLNAAAKTGADDGTDPYGPSSVSGSNTTGWSANWAGGMPSLLEAYYGWMFDDGAGSNNIDCTVSDPSGCWGHRMDALYNFGSSNLTMGFNVNTNQSTYDWSWAAVYWVGTAVVPRIPVVTGISPSSSAVAGGTTVTLSGAGFTGATTVRVGSKAVVPTKIVNNNSLTFKTPAGTGVQQVTVTGTGGTSEASNGGTISYLTARTGGSYVPLTPARLLDTRVGTGATKAKVPANGAIVLTVNGRGGVPASGASAVMLNVTAVLPTKVGNVTVYPHGVAKPTASNLNYQPGQTTANSVYIKLGSDGKVVLTNNSAKPVDLVADVMGYVVAGSATAAGSWHNLNPARVLDTRSGLGAPRRKVAAAGTLQVQVTGKGGVPTAGVSSVIVNLTAVTPAGPGAVTAWASGKPRPTASNLNLRPGNTAPNLAVVPVGAGGKISLYVGSKSPLDLVMDVEGYIQSGTSNITGGAVSLAPARLLDTRTGAGFGPYAPYLTPPDPGYEWGIGGSVPSPLHLSLRGGIPASGVAAVILNVTVLYPTAPGNLTAYADGGSRPNASNVNYIVNQTVPNLAVVPVGTNGLITFYPESTGEAGLVVDVTGYVLAPQG